MDASRPRLLKEASTFSSLPQTTIDQAIRHGYLVMDEARGDVAAGGTGVHRLFSEEMIMQLAIAARLFRHGLGLRDALTAALGFFVARAGREPGKPFPTGDTLMFVAEGASWVVNAYGTAPADALGTFLGDAGTFGQAFEAGRTAVAVVDVGAIYREVRERLRTPPGRAVAE
jgi:hypothetical protein